MSASWMLLWSCGGSEFQPGEASNAALRREGDEAVDAVAVDAGIPDCSILEKCAILALAAVDTSTCVDDPSLLEIELFEGLVVDVKLRPEVAATKVLPAGAFYTVFPDPKGGCGVTVVSFEQEDVAAPEVGEKDAP